MLPSYIPSDTSMYSIRQEDVADLSDQNITTISEIFDFPLPHNLQVLKLEKNKISTIDETISQFKLLRFLNMSSNVLTKIQNLSSFQNLTLLDLSRNKITKLENLENNVKLKRLLIGRNVIQSIKLKKPLTSLILLDIHHNPLTKVNFGKLFPNLVQLYINECRISSLKGLETFSNLKHFKCQKNKINDTESAMLTNPNIEDIDISRNEMTTLAPFLNLTTLKILNIRENPITDASFKIPANLQQKLRDKIPHLQTLIISKTNIQSICLISKLFPNIEYVDISQSQIANIEDVISFVKSAKKLKYLDLLGNPLTKDLYPTEFLENPKSNKDSKSGKSSKTSKDNDDIYESIILFDQKYEQNADQRNSYRQAILQYADASLETLDRIRSVGEFKSSPKCSSLASSSQDFEDNDNNNKQFVNSPNKTFRQKNDDDYEYVYEEEEKQNDGSENENEIASDELEDSQDDIDLISKEKDILKPTYNEISIQTSDEFINQMIDKAKKEEEEKYKKELEKLKSTENKDLEGEVQKLNAKIDKLKDDRNHLNEQVKIANDNVNQINEEKNEILEREKGYIEKINSLNDTIKTLDSKCIELDDSLKKEQEENDKLNDEAQNNHNEIKKLRDTLQNNQMQISTLQREIKDKEASAAEELNQIQKQHLEVLRKASNDNNQMKNELQSKLDEKEEKLKEANENIEQLNIKIKEKDLLLDAANKDSASNSEIQNQIQKLISENEEKENQIQILTSNAIKLKNEIDSLKSSSNDNDNENQNKIIELTKQVESKEIENNDLKSKIDEKDQKLNDQDNQILENQHSLSQKDKEIAKLKLMVEALGPQKDQENQSQSTTEGGENDQIQNLLNEIEKLKEENNKEKEEQEKLKNQINLLDQDKLDLNNQIEELTKKLNSLNPNANENNKEADQEKIKNQLNELQEKVKKINDENASLNQKNQDLLNSINQKDEEIKLVQQNYDAKINENEEKLNESKAQNDKLQEEINQLKKEKEGQEKSSNEINEYETKLNELKTQKDQLQEEINQLKEDKEKSISKEKENQEKSEKEINEYEAKLNESKAQNDKLQEEINQLKKEKEVSESKEKENQEKSSNEFNEYENKLNELKAQNNQLQEEINQLKKDKEMSTSKEKENQEKSEKEIREHESKLNELKTQNNQLQEEINQLKKDQEQMSSKEKENQEKSEKEINEYENKLNELKTQNNQLQDEISQLKRNQEQMASKEKENQEKSEKEISEYEAKLNKLKNQNNQLQEEINQLRKANDAFSSREQESDKDSNEIIQKLKKEIEEKNQSLSQSQKENEELQQKNFQASINLRFIFNRIKEKTNKKKDAINENINKNFLLTINQKLKENEKAIQQIISKVAYLSNKMKNNKNLIQSVNSEKEELTEALNNKIEGFKKQLAQKTEENESLKAKIKSMQEENQFIDEDTKDRRLREYSQKIDSLNCLINHLRSQLSGKSYQSDIPNPPSIKDNSNSNNNRYASSFDNNNNNRFASSFGINNNNNNSNNDYRFTSAFSNNNSSKIFNNITNNRYQLLVLKNQLSKMRSNLNELKESFEIGSFIKDLNWMKRRMMNEFNQGFKQINFSSINNNHNGFKERRSHSSKHNKINNSVQTKITASSFDVSEKLYLYDKKSLHELVHKKTKDIYHHLNNHTSNKENANDSFTSSLLEKLLLSFERQNQTIIEQLSLIRESFRASNSFPNSISSPSPFMNSNSSAIPYPSQVPYSNPNQNPNPNPNPNPYTASQTQFQNPYTESQTQFQNQNQNSIQFQKQNLNQTSNSTATNHSLDNLIRLVSEVLQDNRTIRDEIIYLNSANKSKEKNERIDDKNLNTPSKVHSNKKEIHHNAHKKNDKTLTFNDLESEVEFIDFTDHSKSSHRNKSKSPTSNKKKHKVESSPLNYKSKQTKHSASPSPNKNIINNDKSSLKKKSSRNHSEKTLSFSISGVKPYSFSSYDNEYGNIIYHEDSKDKKKFEIIQKADDLNQPNKSNNNKTSLIDLDYIENSLNYNTEVTENNLSFQVDKKSNLSESKKKKKSKENQNQHHQHQIFEYNDNEISIQKVHYPSYLNPHVSTNSPTKSYNFTLNQGLMSINDCENVILKEASKKNFTELSENSDEFKCVRFWLSVSLRKDVVMKSVIKINSKADFASFKTNFKAVHPILVLLPVESMKTADLNSNSKITIQNDAVVFRYLSRIPKSFPHQFFLCATDLGIQSVQTSLRMEMPLQQELLKIQTAGYDSFIFNHNGIENILIFNPLRIIPLYYISI